MTPPRAVRLPPSRERLLTGWGRTQASRATVVTPRSREEVAAAVARAGARGLVARGLGRAYGDAAQNAGGTVLDMTGLHSVRALDRGGARVTADAGISIGRLIELLLPLGLFPPVTPGTRHVTLGGAVAADVHGKNHHRDGSFAGCVESLELHTPGGERVVATPGDDAFLATAGGMGLTGVILEATVRLLPVRSAYMRVDRERAPDIDDVMRRMVEGDGRYRYSVAWIDCLAGGAQLGRAVLLRGDHAEPEELPAALAAEPLRAARGPSLRVPPWMPPRLLNHVTARAFNEVYFRRAPSCERGRVEPMRSFFFPLDAVAGWNRVYGPRGLLQYQLAVPSAAHAAIRETLERLSGASCPSFLAVLKRFGPQEGMLSFPMEGWTLAVDLPAGVPGLGSLLDELDGLVTEAGGRVYLAKDSRLRPELVEAMYPRLGEWREARARLDPRGAVRSDLARRLGLT